MACAGRLYCDALAMGMCACLRRILPSSFCCTPHAQGAPEALDQTVVSIPSSQADAIEAAATQLVAACNGARQFTDTASFTLRCGICQQGLKGEREAVMHAKETGHTNFSEY